MNTVRVESFGVKGDEARTRNAREMSGQGVIGGMWAAAPPRAEIVVVYSDYESDKDGEYNYLLGVKTAPDETPNKRVEKGDYLLLQFEGPITPEATVGLWRQVWDLEGAGKIQRAYQTDFELYGDARLDLYVGLKPKSW
jgi:predicted transcriptional regulator YdeE